MTDVRDEVANATAAETRAEPRGDFIWYELITSDIAGAKSFYDAVVGWNIADKSDFPNDYRMIGRSDGKIVNIVAREIAAHERLTETQTRCGRPAELLSSERRARCRQYHWTGACQSAGKDADHADIGDAIDILTRNSNGQIANAERVAVEIAHAQRLAKAGAGLQAGEWRREISRVTRQCG